MAVELGELQIDVSELEIGMYVCRLDRPWEETDFLLQGFLITSQDDIDALVEQCDHVYIESRLENNFRPSAKSNERRKKPLGLSARSKAQSKQSAGSSKQKLQGPKTKKKVSYINKLPVEQEFPQARLCFKYAKLTAQNILEGARIGRTLDLNECREVVDDVVDSILRNHNALTWLTRIKNKDDYTAEHSINVCILSVAFAKHLGLDEEEIRSIGLCGLLHDVGKAKIPLEILNKPGRFTDEEMAIMKEHTTFGRDLLMSMADQDLAVIDVAHSHHERMDGQGYPRALAAHQIPFYAQLISITDAYDAITSSRVYDNARSSMNALDIIYKNRNLQFNEELALEFVKFIGVYPPGAIVEMSNGEIGIIISSNKDNKLRPKILLVREADKKTVQQAIIDLQTFPKDSNGEQYNIANELPNGKYGVDIRYFLKRGLKIKYRDHKP